MDTATERRASSDKAVFGFWVYLMTDLVMFGVLFATYAVLRGNTFGGPSGRELFDLKGALMETLALLTSSFTCGIAMLAVYGGEKNRAMAWFAVTFVLGAAFLGLELAEFARFASIGAVPQRSAFLSAFFALVGTHGLHITVGLFWILVSLLQIRVRGLSPFIVSKLARFSLFWHFLDIVWIFIFTVVYLMSHV